MDTPGGADNLQEANDMLRSLSLFIFSLFLLAPAASAAPAVIRMADLENGAMIKISAAGELTVDFTGTPLLDDPHHRLLVIHLQGEGRSDYYSVALVPDLPTYRLDAAVLRPHDAPPFPGFAPAARPTC